MTYEQVIGLVISLATLVLTIGKPLWTMSAKLTSIEYIVKQMQTTQKDLARQVDDHEKRLIKLER